MEIRISVTILSQTQSVFCTDDDNIVTYTTEISICLEIKSKFYFY